MQTLAFVGGWMAVGAVLACGYFGGLWMTVRRLPGRSRPGRAVLESFLVRSAGLLAAVYGLSAAAPRVVLPLMAGFLVARTLWIRAAVAAR